jgi:hypothetical protein
LASALGAFWSGRRRFGRARVGCCVVARVVLLWGEMTFKESLEELLGTERGGVRMPAAMQRLLSKYYVEVALVESLDEVSISNMLADAKLA